MKKRLPKISLLGVTLLAAGSPAFAAFTPAAPGNLKASVSNGTIVDLSWNWGNAGSAVFSESFEEDDLTSSDKWFLNDCYLPEDEESRCGNWRVFDFSEEERPLIHDGVKGAVLEVPQDVFDDASMYHQDEWLVTIPGPGAVYMDFWYYLYPELLEVGSIREFPDHYYVMISRDNGETWTELWDGRWDMGNVDDVQQASLFLGEPTDEETMVAFRGVSADDDTLYFTWIVDDISFYTAEEAATRSLEVARKAPFARPAHTAALPLYRKFTPREDATRMPRRAPENEWLNAGNTTFRVYCDDILVGDYIKTRHFTDASTKPAGKHIYSVCAWSEAEDLEYDAAEIEVATEMPDFKAPRNLKAWNKVGADGRYTIYASWEAPEGEASPSYYRIFVNGKKFAETDPDNPEFEAAQVGCFKGYYTYAVEAVYTMPEGVSPQMTASTAAGTVPAPESAEADIEGSNVTLTWKASSAEGPEPDCYRVFRGEKQVADGLSETSFIPFLAESRLFRKK